MATSSNNKPVYVYDLPYQSLRQLCRILDVDKRWKDLGGTYMGYDITTLLLIEQAIQRDKSPTSELLDKWGERNGTIKGLFVMLAKMDHQRAMVVLKPYVDEKYHKYIQSDDNGTFTLRSQVMDTKGSFAPSFTSRSCSKPSTIQSGSFSKHKEDTFSENRNFQNDMNMNVNISSLSLKSKMNVLDVSDNPSKNGNPSEKWSPGERRSGKSAVINCKAESVTDNNCVPVKVNNVRKFSLPQEILLNGRHIQPSHLASNLTSYEDSLPDIMQISYKDILKATDNFNKSRILGKGGFGTVYKGEWKGTSVAIKRLTPKREGHDTASQQLVSLKQSINELSILKRCRFDHILPLYGVSLDGSDPCLVYQLMVNGSLEDWLVCRKNTPPLTWSQRSHIAECTTKGLNYLHTTPDKPLVHGDIKSANILLDGNMDAKIGDFGLTREGPGQDHTHVKVSSLHGTECYLPPEYLRQRHLSPQVDIYGYGIVLLEMTTGLRPQDTKRGEAKLLVDHVSDCNRSGRLDSLRDVKAGEENMIWFRELLQIGQKCSSKEKKKRPTMQEVLDQFDKVKKEMSMVDKIRRLSNDKGTASKGAKMSEDSEMRKLSPIQLQIFYDLRNDGPGPSQAHDIFEDSHPHNNNVSPSEVPDARSPDRNTDSFEVNASNIETCDSSRFSLDPSAVNQPITISQHNDLKEESFNAPMPLLTVLQMQISEFNDDSQSGVISSTTDNFTSEDEP